MKKIAHSIKLKMQEHDISAHALEKRAGLKPSAVQNILYGRSKNPSIYSITAIAHALNCTVSDLMGEEFLVSYQDQNNTKSPSKSESYENNELYTKCLWHLSSLLVKQKLWLKKEQILDYINETYFFSLRKNSNEVDVDFAQWLIEKGARM